VLCDWIEDLTRGIYRVRDWEIVDSISAKTFGDLSEQSAV